MDKKYKIIFSIFFVIILFLSIILYAWGAKGAVIDTKGIIGTDERDLIYIATLLMLIVIIPVFVMAIAISWRYRASNKDADYDPKWNHDALMETIWWGFPCLIIIMLSAVTWKTSHSLDPFKPLDTGVKPIKIQVVALQWRWLFIYPEEKIASLNFFNFPVMNPLSFEITADAPMNSFWIPQLGGQIYAMPKMRTKLHLLAHSLGEFRGLSANLSGIGFADMTFIARSTLQEDFDKWVKSVQESGKDLDLDTYNDLAKPSEDRAKTSFVLKDDSLFEKIMMKYMHPHKD